MMEKRKTERLVIGICAHVDAGKTTLSEQILFETGVIRKTGRVDTKDAFLDTDAMEKARGITIYAKQAVFPALTEGRDMRISARKQSGPWRSSTPRCS